MVEDDCFIFMGTRRAHVENNGFSLSLHNYISTAVNPKWQCQDYLNVCACVCVCLLVQLHRRQEEENVFPGVSTVMCVLTTGAAFAPFTVHY